ncbi:MAG: hypothetical protein Kow00121_67610 [Elainellaceae cyanobacterium]
MSLAKSSAKERATDPEAQYASLLRSLRRRKGFGILFVRCSPAEATQLIARVRQDLPQKKIAVLDLKEPIDNLYDIIADRPDHKDLNILFIRGIEKSLEPYIKPGYGGEGEYYNLDTTPRILSHLNQQRENFRDHFPNICFVFIVPLFALKFFIRRAPDFFDWRSGIFEFPAEAERVEQASLRFIQESSYEKYRALTSQQRIEKFLEIQELLEERHQTPERKAELYFEQGLLFYAAQDFLSAIESYNQAIQFNPNNHIAQYSRGLSLADLERYEEAIESFDQVLQFKPDLRQAWHNRGNTLADLGRYEEAIASYDKAIQLKLDDEPTWYNRGVALVDLGRYEEAIKSFDHLLAIKLDDYEAWHSRGLTLVDLGRYEEALESFDKAIEFKPDYHQAWYNRGVALGNLGRHEEEIVSFDKAIEFKPDDYEAWYNRGVALGNLGRHEEALESFDKAIKFKPDDHQAWYNRGLALGNLGRYEDAIDAFDKAI